MQVQQENWAAGQKNLIRQQQKNGGFLLILPCHGGEIWTLGTLLIRQQSLVGDFGMGYILLIRQLMDMCNLWMQNNFLTRQLRDMFDVGTRKTFSDQAANEYV